MLNVYVFCSLLKHLTGDGELLKKTLMYYIINEQAFIYKVTGERLMTRKARVNGTSIGYHCGEIEDWKKDKWIKGEDWRCV